MPETFAEILDDSPVSLPDAEQTFRERTNGAGSDNLDALRTPSQSEYGDKSDRWNDISEGSYRVESVLEQELDIERRATRTSGLTTGRFDPTLGWKLGIGETRVFSGPDTGEEKRYHLIFVLDRSYSMGGENIEAATKALATFSHAAEELGIAVSVLDFHGGSARWIKPAVMPTQLAQQALLSTATAGGTPLSDALEMAHSLVNLRDEEPIVITLTDGLPGKIGQTEDQIDAMTAPVCSITVALDEPSGSLPQKADRLEDAYFRSATVWTKDELIDKLEKFAGLLSGL
jgi:hypothetical protein